MVVSASFSAFFVFMGFMHDLHIPATIPVSGGNCSNLAFVLGTSSKICLNKTENKLMLTPGDSYYQTVQKRCSLGSSIDECFESILPPYLSCFNSTHLNALQIWKEIDKEVSEFVCKDKAKVAYDLLEKNDESCFNLGLQQLMDKCLAKIENPIPLYNIEEISKHCSHLDAMRTCMEETAIQVCPKEVVINSVSPIINIVKSHICKDIAS